MKRLLTITLAVLVMATASFAATTATGNTVSPTLQINATVQSVISLTLSTGSAAGITNHCTPVSGSSPDYTMSFGTVDALGLSTPTCGKSFGLTGSNPGVAGTDAIYATDYVLTPAFAGQLGGTTGTIKAYVSTNFTPTNLQVVYDTANSSTLPAAATDFSNMPTTSGTAVPVATAALSGTGVTRFVGVRVMPTNGAGSSGAASATVTYTLTIP
jgi:hypothetical protein